MADVVTFTPQEIPATTGSEKAPQANIQHIDDKAAIVTVDSTVQPVDKGAEGNPDRPSWLPQEFKTPEEFAKAYEALKTPKAPEGNKETPSTPAAPQTPQEAQKVLEKAGLDFSEFSAEFVQNGQLSEESYKKLEAKGITKATADAFVEGQKARQAVYKTEVAKASGLESPEALDGLLKWAAGVLTPQEQDAANKVFQSGDLAQSALVLQGLKARQVAKEGSEPSLVRGRAAGTSGDIQPYESSAQLSADIQNPLYKKDPAFQAKVLKRLSVSNL